MPRRFSKKTPGTGFRRSTRVGAPYRRRRRAATTIQAAYRNRRQFRKNLQPFTETKKQQGACSISGNLQTTSAFTCVLPEKYYFQTQGTGSDQMIGDSVYGRYCGLKLRLGFPQGHNSINISTRISGFEQSEFNSHTNLMWWAKEFY